MSMQLKYFGEFYSRQGILWRIEISQPSDEPLTAKEVRFPGSGALEIEWSNTDKLEPVISSSATLVLRCTNDREYTGLYTEEVGSIRLNIYRNETFYWSGTLDPELYEEPFAYEKEYDVPLSFSDFAPADRAKFAGDGLYTLRELMNMALNSTGMYIAGIEEYISTSMNLDGKGNPLDEITLVADNFYDEDGEPNTMREVLEEVFRSLALRIVQKGGKLVVFDLNSIYTKLTPETIRWESDDATLGVDKVYNNVRVTFSPYDQIDLLNGNMDKEDFIIDDPGRNMVVAVERNWETPGFTIYVGKSSEKKITAASDRGYFGIFPTYSGSECFGVYDFIDPFRNGGFCYGDRSEVFVDGNMNNQVITSELFRVNQTPYLGAITEEQKKNFKLKITLDYLFDVRNNPFEPDSRENEEGNWQRLKDWCNFAYVPFTLTLRDAGGKALWHYVNRDTMRADGYAHHESWQQGEASWGDAFLAYYDKGDRKSNTGLGGWKTNLPCIGYYRDGLPSSFDKIGSGEYIGLPPVSGWLDLRVGKGLHQFDYERKREWIFDRVCWMIHKNPRITLVDNYGNNLDKEDIEYTAWINRSAKEELKIDTIIGVVPEPSPAARGQMLKTVDKQPLLKLYRGGMQDFPERLLIGTVYSNYAHRHNVLSGTVKLLSEFGTYTDRHEPGYYLLKSEVQDCMADESDIEMVEFESDNYEGIEYGE